MLLEYIDNPIVIILTTAFICFLSSYLLYVYLRDKKAEKEAVKELLPTLDEAEKERLKRLEELLVAQNNQITGFNNQLEDYAKLRHDFRHELQLLAEYAKTGNREALEKYLPEIQIEGTIQAFPICENSMINTFLQYYFNKAKASNINIDAAIDAKEDLWLTVSDIGVLFGNLLENAIVAANEKSGNKRNIRIRTTQTKECFIITMGNSFDIPRISSREGYFDSTKAGHKGIGLKSISAIANKYEGQAKFFVDDEIFMSYVILLKPEN